MMSQKRGRGGVTVGVTAPFASQFHFTIHNSICSICLIRNKLKDEGVKVNIFRDMNYGLPKYLFI